MTVNSAAWNPADHPRDAGSGKFSAKAFRDPEAVLVENAAAGVLVPVLDAVPYHQRVAEQGNPILTAYRRAQAEGGATAREWLDAIDTYFDDPETAPRGGVYDHVRDLFGRPEDESDVDGWFGRTNDWRAQAEQALHAELQFTDLAEVPSHSNDSGDWCPYSETMQIGGQCPQRCRDARDEDDDWDNEDELNVDFDDDSDFVDYGLRHVPTHNNDSGDWCPYSGTEQAGGRCPQGCSAARVD